MTVPTLRLRRPDEHTAVPVALDDVQRAVVDRPVGAGHALVVGAPGTGKTTTALATVARRVLDRTRPGDAADGVLVLVPGRQAAARFRDALSERLRRTLGRVLVRTPASYAFSVLRQRAAALGEPPPTLVTGPEQDAVLADLLAGHVAGDVPAPAWPPSLPPRTRALRGFRHELRDLLMRAAEAGLAPATLDELGRRSGRPEWSAAAWLQREYLQVLRLGQLTPDRGERYDAAGIVDAAVLALREWSSDGLPQRAPLHTVVVDDYQDMTFATARLLAALADEGAELVCFGDADVAVQGFRGGAASLVHAATGPPGQVGGFGAERLVLGTVWRQSPRLRAATAAVTARIGTTGGAVHRAAGVPAEQAEPSRGTGLEVAVLRTQAQEAARLARFLREEHLHHGTPYDAMAVITRGHAHAATLRRMLAAAGVPVATEPGAGRALRDEPAVRPLLQAVRAATSGALDVATATDLLTSPLAGPYRLDAVSLRGLRRALLARAQDEDAPSADELLLAVLGDPEACAELPGRVGRAPTHVATMLAAGRAAARGNGDAGAVLWAIWSAAGTAEPWRRVALAGGPGADHADRDLDAVLALFEAAEQFAERNPGAGAEAFVEHVGAQDLPADSLAARAVHRQAVDVLTAAAAAGREWDVVAVAGVQEELWPDLRLRDSLLGAHHLADVVAGRSPDAAPDARRARHDVLQDELRAFALAVSRARRRLLLTAVRDGELAPSPFLDLVDPVGASDAPAPDVRPLGTVDVPLDLRGLVARLRAELPDGPSAPAAARLLARLAAEGVPGADPATWVEAFDQTTSEPLWPAGRPIALSPSAVETAQACPLRWALERVGGRPAGSAEQHVGTLVHEIAAALPHGTHDELAGELDRRWPELGLGEGWVARRQRTLADAMIHRLAGYLAGRPGPVEVEQRVQADVGRVRITGRVDRVEHTGDGSVRIVDLKTGRTPKSAADVRVDPQLGAYQAAIRHGGLGADVRPDGAALVYVGANREAAQRHQPALADDWAEAMLADVAETVASGSFAATVGPHCRTCPVRTSCPALPAGEQVVS